MINTEMLQQERKNTGIGLPFFRRSVHKLGDFCYLLFFTFLGGGVEGCQRFLIRKVSVN